MHYHRAEAIGHPRSTWGVLDGNLTQEQIRYNGALLPVDFLVNVTVNKKRQITRFFCGDVMQAHVAGCAFAKSTAMVACDKPFPIVVTTNSGYPLDQNLYQTVKGMSAAAKVVRAGGTIVCAAECRDGLPAHGSYGHVLASQPTPAALLDMITAPGYSVPDQWQVQIQAQIQLKAHVKIKTGGLDCAAVRAAHFEPIEDVAAAVSEAMRAAGSHATLCVLPHGPQTIPYVRA